jgi:aspartate/methionine/tyrosine aminotransferase
MSRPLAGRTDRNGAPGTLAFVSAARAMEARGVPVIRLDVGEPHLPTPSHIVDAALAAMRDGHTKYVAPQGLPALRAAVAVHLAARGLSVTADDIVVGSGVKPLLLYVLLALVEQGDEVLVPDPGYPGYADAARLAGARARSYPIPMEAGVGTLDLDALCAAITPATRVLVLNSPHNPTGVVIDEQTIERVAELAGRHNLWIVSDEIYGPLTYDRALPRSIASLPRMAERTVVLDGFSKAYAMTGWRLGFAILPRHLVAPVSSIVGDASTCTPAFVQHAGVAALTGPQDHLEEMRRQYSARRNALVQQLRAMPGVHASTPAGAFYAFADVRGLFSKDTISSVDAATDLLTNHRLACVAGSVFGSRGEGHLRFSFAVARDELASATRQLEAWATRRECGANQSPCVARTTSSRAEAPVDSE